MKNRLAKLIVRRDESGQVRVIMENAHGQKIRLEGVVKVHFVTYGPPQVVVTMCANEIDAEVEISEPMADALADGQQGTG